MSIAIILTTAFLLIALRLAVELALNFLNRKEVRRHIDVSPAAASAIMDVATYKKSCDYTLAKGSFARIELVIDAVILVAILFSGVLPRIYQVFTGLDAPGAQWTQVAFVIGTGIVLSLISLPLDWWGQFRIEQKFGFNKSTAALWVSDKIKGAILAIVIGVPLLWVLLALATWLGNWWWIWGFALIFVFQLLMLVLYPKLILPLFNKLTPLPEGELRTRLLALSESTGFHASTIQVMDGSKRSGHSNAFFTGFGRFRRIVLFDTLIAQLTTEELEAVLAHEIGHYKRGHIPKSLAVTSLMMLCGFALVAWLINCSWFNPAFGFEPGQFAPALLLFSMLSSLFTFWFTPIGNFFSRKHEYEADAFARDAMHGPAPLVAALRKLAQKNLSNLTPHPLYSRFYYSHPTLVEREAALNASTPD